MSQTASPYHHHYKRFPVALLRRAGEPTRVTMYWCRCRLGVDHIDPSQPRRRFTMRRR
jgi:hypothetical protein